MLRNNGLGERPTIKEPAVPGIEPTRIIPQCYAPTMTEADHLFLADVGWKISTDFRSERAVEWLHRLSPRSVYELFLELAATDFNWVVDRARVDEFVNCFDREILPRARRVSGCR